MNFDPRLAKFWTKVDIPSHKHWEAHCWEWKAAITTDNPRDFGGGLGGGYGCLTVNGRWFRAHRFLWERINGPIPQDKVIAHTCDNRRCVNPSHLRLATVSENNREAWERSRVPF